MKKVIFWDSDGTLLYGNESFKSALIRAFQQFGHTLEEDAARTFIRSVCSWYHPEKDHSDQNGEEWWTKLMQEISRFCVTQGVCSTDISSICRSFRENVITFEY